MPLREDVAQAVSEGVSLPWGEALPPGDAVPRGGVAEPLREGLTLGERVREAQPVVLRLMMGEAVPEPLALPQGESEALCVDVGEAELQDDALVEGEDRGVAEPLRVPDAQGDGEEEREGDAVSLGVALSRDDSLVLGEPVGAEVRDAQPVALPLPDTEGDDEGDAEMHALRSAVRVGEALPPLALALARALRLALRDAKDETLLLTVGVALDEAVPCRLPLPLVVGLRDREGLTVPERDTVEQPEARAVTVPQPEAAPLAERDGEPVVVVDCDALPEKQPLADADSHADCDGVAQAEPDAEGDDVAVAERHAVAVPQPLAVAPSCVGDTLPDAQREALGEPEPAGDIDAEAHALRLRVPLPLRDALPVTERVRDVQPLALELLEGLAETEGDTESDGGALPDTAPVAREVGLVEGDHVGDPRALPLALAQSDATLRVALVDAVGDTEGCTVTDSGPPIVTMVTVVAFAYTASPG